MITAAAAATALAFASAGPTVAVKDDFFSPKTVTVKKGTKIKWSWKGSAPHNVTVTSGPRKFRSSTQSSGKYKKKMKKKGTYTLLCTVHAPDMKMTVKVN